MTSIDHHAFVIFFKIPAIRRRRYTEIKISSHSSLRIPAGILQNHASVGHYYTVFERASYAHVSVMINPHTVEFISNLIEYECDAMISQCHVSTLDHFVLRQFSLDIQKAFVRQWVQILLQYGYSYFVAVSERCVGERAVRVSTLNLDNAIVEDRLFNV